MSYSILLYYYYIIAAYYYTVSKHDPSVQNTASFSSSSSSSSSFFNALFDVTKYTSFRELSTLYYGDAPIGSTCVVSSIDFDKDDEFFAVGGYTKRIKVRLLFV